MMSVYTDGQHTMGGLMNLHLGIDAGNGKIVMMTWKRF